MSENIDKAGGPGTAIFAKQAVDKYCNRQNLSENKQK